MLNHFAQSHIGQRSVNEDSYFVDEKLGLYIVADGVGGLDKGEVASQIACKIIHESIKKGLGLVESIEAAHQKIISEMQSNEHKKGMASTVIVALFKDNTYKLAWVGDTRAYLWDGGLNLITRDHSYVELLHAKGHISFEEMAFHPNKNVISQALGSINKTINIECNEGTLEKNQILMLATDGLYEISKEKTIIDEINHFNSVEELTESLVLFAAQHQGRDNITLISIQSDVNSEDSSAIKLANVVRTYDSNTGVAQEINNKAESIIDQEPKVIENFRVKSIKPKALELPDEIIDVSYSYMELILYILFFIILMVLITLIM